MYMNRLGYFKGMHENGGRQTRSLVLDQNSGSLSSSDQERMTSLSNVSAPLHDSQALEQARIGSELNRTQNIKSRLAADGSVAKERHHSGKKTRHMSLQGRFVLCSFLFLHEFNFVLLVFVRFISNIYDLI